MSGSVERIHEMLSYKVYRATRVGHNCWSTTEDWKLLLVIQDSRANLSSIPVSIYGPRHGTMISCLLCNKKEMDSKISGLTELCIIGLGRIKTRDNFISMLISAHHDASEERDLIPETSWHEGVDRKT